MKKSLLAVFRDILRPTPRVHAETMACVESERDELKKTLFLLGLPATGNLARVSDSAVSDLR